MLAQMTARLLQRRTFEDAIHVILEDVIALHGAEFGNVQLPLGDELVIAARSPFKGVRVANVSPALADELRIDPSVEGVVILDVANGTPAQSVGFQRGDIVLAVNNQAIAKTRDLERVTATPSRAWRVTIRRGSQQMTVMLNG